MKFFDPPKIFLRPLFGRAHVWTDGDKGTAETDRKRDRERQREAERDRERYIKEQRETERDRERQKKGRVISSKKKYFFLNYKCLFKR